MEQELKHYGVLGMKWGKRKADYLHKKASNLAGRRMASDQLATGYNVMSNRASNEWTKRGTSSYAKSYQKERAEV